MPTPSSSTYPPTDHILNDLGIAIERDLEHPDRTRATLDLRPAFLDDTGRPRVGVLAILADVIAGESAIRSVMPNWAATSDLSLAVADLPSEGPIEATLDILRSGRQTVVLEVHLHPPGAPRGDARFGLATLTFSVLPGRGNDEKTLRFSESVGQRTDFSSLGQSLEKPIGDALGLEPDPMDPSILRLPMRPYVENSLGALQGGVGAVLLEAAAEQFARHELDAPVRVRSLAIHYLKLGRIGPIRATARTLTQTPAGLLARVALHDEGKDDALLSVANVQVDLA